MPAPTNDNFASATVITGASGSQTGTNVLATTQGSEPGHYNYSLFPHYPVARAIIGPFATVWYSWTCPATGDYFFSTRDLTGANRTNFKSTIQAFTGSAVGSLTPVTLLLDQGSGEGFSTSNFASIAFTATSGTVYSIQVDGLASGDQGLIYLTWGAYVAVRFGACNSCGPDFINEICLGTLSITDVTTDAIYSFGSFALDPGNWKIRYCGGYFYENNWASPFVPPGYQNWCGFLFNTANLPTIWNPTTNYPSGAVTLFTDFNIGVPGNSYQSLVGLFISTGTNSVWTPSSSACFTSTYFPCNGGVLFNDGTWTWATLTGGYSISNNSDCCKAVSTFVFGGTFNTYSGGGSGYGKYCPNLSGAWVTTDACAYVGGHWGGGSFAQLGSKAIQYATPALAQAAIQCTDTGWFKNIAGYIGTAFSTWRVWDNTNNTAVCDTQTSVWVNGPKNPTIQLIWQPFTIGMLAVDPQNCTPSGSGTSWTFDFAIKNLVGVAWDNTTITLLATGGITSPGSPAVVTLGGSSTSNVSITGTADPTAGLITATIQISRNGVVVGNLTYPLYPILPITLSGVVGSGTYCCAVPAYRQQIQLNGSAQVSNLSAFHGTITGSSQIIETFEIDSGAINVYDCGSCSMLASDTNANALSGLASNQIFPTYVRQVDISAGVHTLSMTVGWKVSNSVTLALPSASFSVTYP